MSFLTFACPSSGFVFSQFDRLISLAMCLLNLTDGHVYVVVFPSRMYKYFSGTLHRYTCILPSPAGMCISTRVYLLHLANIQAQVLVLLQPMYKFTCIRVYIVSVIETTPQRHRTSRRCKSVSVLSRRCRSKRKVIRVYRFPQHK